MEKTEPEIFLGFAEETKEDLSTQFPDRLDGKIGGKPLWLDPVHLPEMDVLKCLHCQKPMPLLLQIYAPLDWNNNAFHRVLYVFCCRDGECHKRDFRESFKILRFQLPRINTLYVENTEELSWSLNSELKLAPTCDLCGCSGTLLCSGCRSVRYCSKNHQREHWKESHKQQCKSLSLVSNRKINGSPSNEDRQETSRSSSFLFNEFALVTEKEEIADSRFVEEKEKPEGNLLPREALLSLKQTEESGTSELMKTSFGDFNEEDDVELRDKEFSKFQRLIDSYPSQCIRYYGWDGGRPVWVDKEGKPLPSDIPNCPRCSSERIAEFQILPQLLYTLGMDQSLDEKENIDWGILTVFTCKSSCPVDTNTKIFYSEEFIWRQNYSMNSNS